jgi:UPF0755 protein
MAERKKTSVRKKSKTARPAAKKPAVRKKAVPQRVKRAAPKKKIARARRRILPYVLGAVIVSLFFVIHSLFVSTVVSEAREYVVPAGASVSSVARDLGQGGVFKTFVFLHGNKVMAGTYDLPEGAGAWRLAKMLARGEIASVPITIPEGLTIRQIELLLEENRFLSGEIKEKINDGALFPDTYVVPKGTNRQAVIGLMKKKMDKIRDGWEKSGGRLPSPLKDWNDVITLASIVQKETPKVSEMPLVASVYINRLRKKMRLQADPTIVYVITNRLGDMQGQRLYSKHLWVASPYNTYRNAGLPPAPIANAGMDAIAAVLNPADTNYYYFVADGTGGHKFSRTLEEHNAHRIIWQKIKKGIGR